MKEPLMSEGEFESMRLYVIMFSVVYRLAVMPTYLQVRRLKFFHYFRITYTDDKWRGGVVMSLLIITDPVMKGVHIF